MPNRIEPIKAQILEAVLLRLSSFKERSGANSAGHLLRDVLISAPQKYNLLFMYHCVKSFKEFKGLTLLI